MTVRFIAICFSLMHVHYTCAHVYAPVMSYFRIWFHILSHCISFVFWRSWVQISSQRLWLSHANCQITIKLVSLDHEVCDSPDHIAHCQSCSFFCNSCFCKYVWENQV